MNFCPISDINDELKNDAHGFAGRSEDLFQQQLLNIAYSLREKKATRHVILLSGPSGSGKTTTARRIEDILDKWGCETHTISMDNYFLPYGNGPMPLDENGNIDLESPLRLDSELFAEHLRLLSEWRTVDMPIFSFKDQQRSGSCPISIKPGELVIFEGIHALNPEVTGPVDSFAAKIYVSVRTRIEDGQKNTLHPSKIRLTRRLIRDKRMRGYSFEDTLNNFFSVSRGEDLYIMPYRKYADYDIDTFIPYELSAYRSVILEQLIPIREKHEDINELCKFLDQLSTFDYTTIPGDSIIREFIGGSIFE